jgi:hypothetical protein
VHIKFVVRKHKLAVEKFIFQPKLQSVRLSARINQDVEKPYFVFSTYYPFRGCFVAFHSITQKLSGKGNKIKNY